MKNPNYAEAYTYIYDYCRDYLEQWIDQDGLCVVIREMRRDAREDGLSLTEQALRAAIHYHLSDEGE